ncbi:MAG TPA: xanthine dehydrogenase small subunit [Bacteroidales bacterium]|nr:xanthine dehydrogenase small subunit [Bacteroidales bacterium]
MTAPRDTIQFVLNDKIVTVDFNFNPELKPTTTVLNYLRSLPFHKGVKEGCAEGDCGACTVVIAENKEGKLRYKTIDSCLVFLPMIHGKQLITVENLADANSLHPVQQEMVNHNGSQCGYCTPGIVMSLFGLYKNHHNPEREVIEDALTGNLCRCTGYQPIIKAAEHACSCVDTDKFKLHEKQISILLDEINRDRSPLEIETSAQKYYKPLKLADALAFRNKFPGALIISGATDSALRQTKKHEVLSEILDISDVTELNYFVEDQQGYKIGAGLSLENLKSLSAEKLQAIHSVLKIFGSLQIRNLATLGGNIGSASPIGDMLPLMLAYEAHVKLQSVTFDRIIRMDEFLKGYRSTHIRPNELITAIHIPKPEPGTIIKSYKVSKRKDLDISTVSGGFSLQLERGNVKEIILAFGGMADMPKRATDTEKHLLEKPWTRPNVDQAMKILATEFSPLSDARAVAEYRSLVARNLLLKFYTETSTPGL